MLTAPLVDAQVETREGAVSLDVFKNGVLEPDPTGAMRPWQRFEATTIELVDAFLNNTDRALSFRAMCGEYLGDWRVLIGMFDKGCETAEDKDIFQIENGCYFVAQMLWILAQAVGWEHCADWDVVKNQSAATTVEEWAIELNFLSLYELAFTEREGQAALSAGGAPHQVRVATPRHTSPTCKGGQDFATHLPMAPCPPKIRLLVRTLLRLDLHAAWRQLHPSRCSPCRRRPQTLRIRSKSDG
jgi:hypothetical protein